MVCPRKNGACSHSDHKHGGFLLVALVTISSNVAIETKTQPWFLEIFTLGTDQLMATAYETSPTKYAPSDWAVSNEVIQSSAERQRLASHRIRQESNQTRNETSMHYIHIIINILLNFAGITTKWTQHSNDTSLHQRIGDVTDWKSTLQHTLSETESAITKLSESKRLAECALMAKEMPLHVVLECLVTRENRVAIDLVRDEIEAELNKVREEERNSKECSQILIGSVSY